MSYSAPMYIWKLAKPVKNRKRSARHKAKLLQKNRRRRRLMMS